MYACTIIVYFLMVVRVDEVYVRSCRTSTISCIIISFCWTSWVTAKERKYIPEALLATMYLYSGNLNEVP